MKEQFSDYETAKMLKELHYPQNCFCCFHEEDREIKLSSKRDIRHIVEIGTLGTFDAPLWQELKQWLWEKHKIIIEIQDISTRSEEEQGVIYESECNVRDGLGELIDSFENESPITAERDGIKKAVEYLYAHSEGRKTDESLKDECDSQKVCSLTYLSEIMGGKKLLIKEIMDVFIKQVPLDLVELSKEVQAKNMRAIKSIAHSLKASCSIMGIAMCHALLGEMEELAKEDAYSDAIAGLYEKIELILKKAVNEIMEEKKNYI